MKKYLFITMICGLLFPFTGMAQKQPALSRFIVGTNPFDFSVTGSNSQMQYSDGSSIPMTNSNKFTTDAISAHINLFVGYFVTKNICAGLQFGKNTILSPFIRYYLFRKNPDSSKVDFFLQANFTVDYTNVKYPDQVNNYENGYEETSAYSVNTTIFNFGVGAAVAWHFNRHWSLEGELGYIYENSVINTGSYNSTTVQIDPITGNRIVNGGISPTIKNTNLTDGAALRLMLSYRL